VPIATSHPKGQRDALKATLETRQPMLAPIAHGQQLGTLHLTLNEKPYLDLPWSRWKIYHWQTYSHAEWTISACCSNKEQYMTVYLNGASCD